VISYLVDENKKNKKTKKKTSISNGMTINFVSTKKMTNKLTTKMPANGIKCYKIPGSGDKGEKKIRYMKWTAM
jgi:superfamily II DNA/RNA helicase